MKKLLILILSLGLAGCATLPTSLSQETIERTQKIAIATTQLDKEFSVLDHTGTLGKTYTGGQFGAIGGFLEGIILSVEATIKINASLGGDPDTLKKSLEGFPIQAMVNDELLTKLSSKFSLIGPEYFKEQTEAVDSGVKWSSQDYIDISKKNNADLFVNVGFKYGLAAYESEKASAAIDVQLSIYDVSEGKVLLKKDIYSDHFFKEGYSVDEFQHNNAEKFKQDIRSAAEALAILIASEFGLYKKQVAEVKKNFEVISVLSVNCDKPYEITQDCSNFWGPKRPLRIGKYKVKIAGSHDGKIAVVYGGHSMRILRELRSILESYQISIINIKKFGAGKIIEGYFLEFDGDGYSVLKDY